MCDDNGFILHTMVKASNVHGSQVLHELFHRVKEKVDNPSALVLDAGYKTFAVAKLLIDEEVRPGASIYSHEKGISGNKMLCTMK
jgi:hypothetical protein